MKTTPILAAMMAVIVALPVAAADEHQHQQASDHVQLSLDHGRKWPTDKPLRSGMTQIRSSLADHLDRIHQDKLSSAEYQTMGRAIQQQVSTIISQCKLEPQADAMLHIVLTDLLAGADAMQGKGNMTPAAGAHKAVEALNAYGNYFNHSGWRSLP